MRKTVGLAPSSESLESHALFLQFFIALSDFEAPLSKQDMPKFWELFLFVNLLFGAE